MIQYLAAMIVQFFIGCRCPFCGRPAKEDGFLHNYWQDSEYFCLIWLPVLSCKKCNEEWIDFRGEKIRHREHMRAALPRYKLFGRMIRRSLT